MYNYLFRSLQVYARESRKTKFYKVLWLATLLKQVEALQDAAEKEAHIQRAQIAAGYTAEKGPATPRKKGKKTSKKN